MQAATSSLIDFIESLAAVIILIAGAAWSYTKWKVRREHAPRLEFAVTVNFVGKHGDQWVVELIALLKNKGHVQHKIRDFSFDLRYLTDSDPITYGDDKINHQLYLPHEGKSGAWIPASWGWTFIEPGLKARYSHVTTIPAAAKFVLLHGRFDYPRDDFHTADRLLAVPGSLASRSPV